MMARSWIFQSNPKSFNIDDALIEAKKKNHRLAYTVNRYLSEYKINDTLYIWRSQSSGKYKSTPGIIAKGVIKTLPKEIEFPDWEKEYLIGDFAIANRVFIEIHNIASPDQILSKDILKKDPLLSKLTIIKSPEGTNFKLTTDQANHLRQLWSQKAFPFKKGESIKRTEVHKKLAGSGQGGINPTRHGDVLLFSDPKVGEEFGYHDGWDGDSYLYSGEGQIGDMEFIKGNKAIRDHAQNGANIYLFFGSKGTVTYENQFALNHDEPYQLVDAKDKNGEDRQAIIFKLNPIEKYQSLLPKTNRSALGETKSEIVSEEAFETETSNRKQEEKIITSERKESKLMDQFRRYREQNSQSVLKRYKIEINSNIYWTDGWCEDEEMLIEAKSSSSRNHIRLAIGQLLDYRRHINPRPKKLAILVPTKPQEDLINLISELEISLIYREGNNFYYL